MKTLLLFSCFLSICIRLSAQSSTLEVPLQFHDGHGFFAPGYGGVNWERGAADNDWFGTYQPVKGIPDSWRDTKKGSIWIDAHQFTYQHYKAGTIGSAMYQDLQKSWNWTPDTTQLSAQPIRCFVAVLTGTDSDGNQKVLVDTNHNHDFSDEKPIELSTTESIWKTGIPQEAVVTLPADYYRAGKVVTYPIRMLFALAEDRVVINYPTYATATIRSGNQTKQIQLAPDMFMNPIYEPVIAAVVTARTNAAHRFSKDDLLEKGEYITVGMDVFEIDRVDYSRKLLRLNRVRDRSRLVSSQVGFRAHPVEGMNLLTGKNLSLADYKGRYVLIDFWGTWCSPCRAETPNLRMAYQTFNRADLEIIGVGCDDTAEKIKAYCTNEKAEWPQILANDTNNLVERYHVNSWPTTLLIDRDGKVVLKGLRGPQMMNILYQFINRKP